MEVADKLGFTKSAEENNAENLLVIHDKKLAERYEKNWEEHAKHSEVHEGESSKGDSHSDELSQEK